MHFLKNKIYEIIEKNLAKSLTQEKKTQIEAQLQKMTDKKFEKFLLNVLLQNTSNSSFEFVSLKADAELLKLEYPKIYGNFIPLYSVSYFGKKGFLFRLSNGSEPYQLIILGERIAHISLNNLYSFSNLQKRKTKDSQLLIYEETIYTEIIRGREQSETPLLIGSQYKNISLVKVRSLKQKSKKITTERTFTFFVYSITVLENDEDVSILGKTFTLYDSIGKEALEVGQNYILYNLEEKILNDKKSYFVRAGTGIISSDKIVPLIEKEKPIRTSFEDIEEVNTSFEIIFEIISISEKRVGSFCRNCNTLVCTCENNEGKEYYLLYGATEKEQIKTLIIVPGKLFSSELRPFQIIKGYMRKRKDFLTLQSYTIIPSIPLLALKRSLSEKINRL